MVSSSEKRKVGLRCITAILLWPLCIAQALAEATPQQQDASSNGARIFVERCVLCHGNYGAGDGFMSLVITDYPETNLLHTENGGHFSELQDDVKWGGAKGQMNYRSPPWVDELNPSEMEAVTQFVSKLKDNPEQAWQSLDKYLANRPVSVETGRLVYKTRCVRCHGSSGGGDGPMSAIIKTPPPSNLKLSQLTASEIAKIVLLGGESVGRSGQMPAWENELTQVQIESVTKYVMPFRD